MTVILPNNPAQWLNLWVTGDWLNALIAPFVGTMGIWFYGALLITILMISWFKTKSIFMVSFLGAIYAFAMTALLPFSIEYLVYYALVLAIFAILTKLLSSGG